jgi:hypothetical protein
LYIVHRFQISGSLLFRALENPLLLGSLSVSHMPSNHHILRMIKARFDHLRTARAP